MSSLSEQNPLNPQDPLHYAPRWLRERPEAARLTLVEEPREKPQAVERAAVERPERPVATTNPLDARLESAVFESLRHSLDPHVMRDPPEFTRERDRRSVAFKIAGRFAAAIGVAAVIALFFVNIVPSRKPDASSSFVAAVQSMKTTPAPAPAVAPGLVPPPLAAPETKDVKADETEAKPGTALSQFQSLLASGDAAQAPQPAKSELSEKPLLQQFMQWNQKAQSEKTR